MRKIIYTTNAIESLHMQLRKVLKNRGHFPGDEAATKLIYLALRNVTKRWKSPPVTWRAAATQFAACRDRGRVPARHLDRYEGPFLFPAGDFHSLKATVEAFSRAYEAATPDEQAALRAWMRSIILPRDFRRSGLGRVRRTEKESVVARDHRILEFPLTMSPKEVAKAYSQGTTVYYIEYRIRRLREQAESDRTRRLG